MPLMTLVERLVFTSFPQIGSEAIMSWYGENFQRPLCGAANGDSGESGVTLCQTHIGWAHEYIFLHLFPSE